LKKSNFNLILGKLGKTKTMLKLGRKAEIKKETPIKKKQICNIDNSKFLLNNSNFEDITFKEIHGNIGLREPIYCFCNYVSYGDMVKCDNPKVKFF
jgi:hypothetical protein